MWPLTLPFLKIYIFASVKEKLNSGLNFLLRCNYDVKHFDHLPTFYKDILTALDELKSLYSYEDRGETILFNNKEILVDSKPFFVREWFSRGIFTIKDLLKENGH